jgi:hypothetical protein
VVAVGIEREGALMESSRHHGRRVGWPLGALTAVFLALTPWLEGALPQGTEQQAEATSQKSPVQRGHVAVQQGRLSVDLRNADVAAVFTEIERQAEIPLIIDPMDRQPISVQFSDIELEQGLRRILRLASLSYTILYTLKPDGNVDIKEVRVFAPEKKAPSQRLGAERNIEERVDEVGVGEASQRFVEAFAQAQAASPEAAEEESEAARRFREAFERTHEPAPEPSDEPESEASRRFREALKQGRPRGVGAVPSTKPADTPGQERRE